MPENAGIALDVYACHCASCLEARAISEAHPPDNAPRWECDACLQHFHSVEYVIDGGYFCESCVGNLTYNCDECDSLVRLGSSCCEPDDYDDYSDPSAARLESYSYKPQPLFYGDSSNPRMRATPGEVYVGLELECESMGESISRGIETVYEALGDLVYFKPDGSLTEGVEIVTHPMTREYFQSLDLSCLDSLRRSGWRSWNAPGGTCGIHVHIGRDAFAPREVSGLTEVAEPITSDLERLRREMDAASRRHQDAYSLARTISDRHTWQYRDAEAEYLRCGAEYDQAYRAWSRAFARRNGETVRGSIGSAHLWRFVRLIAGNPTEAQRFAGRAGAFYASFSGEGSAYHCCKVVKGEQNPARYVAVNLQNSSTVEVRMFRGSLRPARVLANLEFVVAACEYTRGLTYREVVNGALTWSAFADWVAEQSEYPNLAVLLKRGTVGRRTASRDDT